MNNTESPTGASSPRRLTNTTLVRDAPGIGSILAIVAAVCVPSISTTHAQTTLDTIVVTPTRTARSADETIAPVTVITRDDIDASGVTSVPDALRALAGVALSTNGGYGKATGIFIRGTETDHALVLVDGVRLYSATLGRSSLELIPLDQIERIEVLRGPRASLYGAEALGGVVHIFTRGKEGVDSQEFSAGYGSDSTSELSAGFTRSLERTRYSVRVNRFDTDGIDVTDGAQLDRDPYDNTSVTGTFKYRASKDTEFGIDLLYATGSTAFDNSFDSADVDHDSDFDQRTTSLSSRFKPRQGWASSVRLSNSEEGRDSFRNNDFQNRFDTERNEVAWQNDIDVGETNLFTFGVDYSDDKVDSTTVFDISSRANTGIYAQWQGDYDMQGIVAAIRYDDNEQFGGQTNGSVDYRYNLNADLRLRFGVGTGFKAPSFNELYFPDFGNPNLDVEKADSFELGLQGDTADGRWTATYFRTNIDDLIVFDNATLQPVNVARAKISGVEVDYRAEIGDWIVGAGLNLLRPKDRSSGKRLIRRADSDLRLSLGRDFGAVDAALSAVYTGRRFEDADNTIELDSFVLANLTGRWEFADDLSIGVDLENLLDEDYETAAGFNERGRTFFVRLGYAPER